MSEGGLASVVSRNDPPTPAEDLARRAGAMAGRMASYLRSALRGDGPIIAGLEFLESCAGDAEAVPRPGSVGAIHPLERLAAGFSLSEIDLDLVVLAGMAEEHEGFADVFRLLHPRGAARPTAGLAARVVTEGGSLRVEVRARLENGPLATWSLIEAEGDDPFFTRSLRLAPGLWPALAGMGSSGVEGGSPSAAVAGLETWLDEPDVRQATELLSQGQAVTVLATADRPEVAFYRGVALVERSGRSVSPIRSDPARQPIENRRLLVETWLSDAVPVVELARREDDRPAPARLGLDGYPGPVVVCAEPGAVALDAGRPVFAVRCPKLDPLALRRSWAEAIPGFEGESAALAARFPVEPYFARRIAGDLEPVPGLENRAPRLEDVARAVRARSTICLDRAVQRLRPRASFEDLVLPAEAHRQLHRALERLHWQARVFEDWGFLRHRRGARGVRMLFWGVPGTGKTLAAEVLAQALDVDLLVVDLSRVVSKWIGETEKNLARVFDVAERSCAVLLFDEADALFGKRTEVSDAHDRYANLETAYLLSRLERFEGLAILATNLKQNIDTAFLRRLEFVVEFREPEVEERLGLWKCHLPAEAPLGERVDLERLAARYPAVGGMIRNAAVSAAFQAAAAGTPIDQQYFIDALKTEYRKSGKAFPEVVAVDRN